VAFDAGIINSKFYTTLVIVAVLTSQAAGAWIERLLRKGLPLLSVQKPIEQLSPSADEELAS
jgi:hypothetical protein